MHNFHVFQLQDQLENLQVSPGDVIGLQHNVGPASLIHCQSSPHSSRQPVFALSLSESLRLTSVPGPADNSASDDGDPLPGPQIDVQASVENGGGSWLENVVCPVRVLYMGQSETRLQGAQLAAGLPQPGLYTLLVGPVLHLFLCSCLTVQQTCEGGGAIFSSPMKLFQAWSVSIDSR